MPDYINAISDNSNAENSIVSTLTNNPWIQPNTYFKLLKRGQELSTLFFTFYVSVLSVILWLPLKLRNSVRLEKLKI